MKHASVYLLVEYGNVHVVCLASAIKVRSSFFSTISSSVM